MSIITELKQRSNSTCELCGSIKDLKAYQIEPKNNGGIDENILACGTCIDQIKTPEKTDPNHWRCLNESMWSEFQGVQVIAWRMLNRLKNEGWPQDLLEMLYLEDAVLKYAEATGEGINDEDKIIHKDCNGAILSHGDTISLTQDLDVKGGGNFTAKRGTAVRNISLTHDNGEHIEGRINGIHIVILTKFVKKSFPKE
jgi:protein PhnA